MTPNAVGKNLHSEKQNKIGMYLIHFTQMRLSQRVFDKYWQ